MLNKDRHGAWLGTYEIVGQMAVVHMLNKHMDMALVLHNSSAPYNINATESDAVVYFVHSLHGHSLLCAKHSDSSQSCHWHDQTVQTG